MQAEVDAVKVFRFRQPDRSLLSRFQAVDPGREVVTEGGPLQGSIGANAQNLGDDPIFSVGGDLAFNWNNWDNGHRIVMTGGYLTPLGASTDGTRGLGNHFSVNPVTGVVNEDIWKHEISNIQDCQSSGCHYAGGNFLIQGTDHGGGRGHLITGPVYGNYAIYVSKDATSFPRPGHRLDLEVSSEEQW